MPEEITTTTTTYTLPELAEINESAYERAYQWVAEGNVDGSYWHEHLTSDAYGEDGRFKIDAAGKGIRMRDLYFTGFYSQGDGASFTGTVEYEEFIRANKLGRRYRRLLNHVRDTGMSCDLGITGRYSYSGTMCISDADYYTDPLSDSKRAYQSSVTADGDLLELLDEIIEVAQDLAGDFYSTLRDEYEYLTAEEQVHESAEANEYRFTEDGNVF